MSTARTLLASSTDDQEREQFAKCQVARNIRERRPDLGEDVVRDLATFFGTLKEGVYRKTAEIVPPGGDPISRQTRVRRVQEQLAQTRVPSTDEVGKIGRSSEIGRGALARALRAYAARLEVRRGPMSIPGKGGSR